jgi:ankyrin repeat protein
MIELLLEYGADVNAKNKDGVTTLMRPALGG